jgi:hypothetical protein
MVLIMKNEKIAKKREGGKGRIKGTQEKAYLLPPSP